MEALRLLEHQALIDERVEHLASQTHRCSQLWRDRLAVDLLVVLFGVIQRAIVFAKGDRLSVHARRVGALLITVAAGAAGAPIHEDEEDENRHNGDKDPLQLLKTVAHQLEHRE